MTSGTAFICGVYVCWPIKRYSTYFTEILEASCSLTLYLSMAFLYQLYLVSIGLLPFHVLFITSFVCVKVFLIAKFCSSPVHPFELQFKVFIAFIIFFCTYLFLP